MSIPEKYQSLLVVPDGMQIVPKAMVEPFSFCWHAVERHLIDNVAEEIDVIGDSLAFLASRVALQVIQGEGWTGYEMHLGLYTQEIHKQWIEGKGEPPLRPWLPVGLPEYAIETLANGGFISYCWAVKR